MSGLVYSLSSFHVFSIMRNLASICRYRHFFVIGEIIKITRYELQVFHFYISLCWIVFQLLHNFQNSQVFIKMFHKSFWSCYCVKSFFNHHGDDRDRIISLKIFFPNYCNYNIFLRMRSCQNENSLITTNTNKKYFILQNI